MHILLTRPLEDCSEMILKFQSLGHQVSHLPLIRIEKVNYQEINFSEYGGIVFTSANAVKFLNTLKLDKNIKCFCVGNATENKARSVGFQNTIAASSFLNFIKIYQTENLWMNTNLMCIGEKTSSILNEIKWKKIFLFNPGEEEFLLYKI